MVLIGGLRCYGQMKGPATECEHPRVPAGEVEQVIIDKIREVCADPTVRGELNLPSAKAQGFRE
jgi:hypothetical protein